VDSALFQRDFSTDIHKKLCLELLLLKLGGVVVEKDGKFTVTRRGMYSVSVMMREFFAALNTLREYCIENQI
jgi:hypothetical protein